MLLQLQHVAFVHHLNFSVLHSSYLQDQPVPEVLLLFYQSGLSDISSTALEERHSYIPSLVQVVKTAEKSFQHAV